MGVWGLIQIVFDIFLALGLGVCVLRVSRRPQDDPRLSRALQMLQSKIAVLEDLADRVDAQALRITEMLSLKDVEIQEKIDSADGRIQSLRDAVDQGIETVRLAQSSLKAEDILEKKSSQKYTQAARMVHEGHSIESVARDLGIPLTEVEFISKVNRDTLRTGDGGALQAPSASHANQRPSFAPDVPADFAQIFEIPTFENEASSSPLSRLGEEFRRATQYVDMTDEAPVSHLSIAPSPAPYVSQPTSAQAAAAATAPQAQAASAPQPAQPMTTEPQRTMPQSFVSSKSGSSNSHLQKAANAAPVIRKVEFPRIDSNR